MILIKINDHNNGLKQLVDRLSSKELKIASTRAINVALRKANVQYKKEISREYNLKYGETKDIPVVKSATYSKTEGTISGLQRPISLSRFNPVFEDKHEISGKKLFVNPETGRKSYRKHTISHKLKGVTVEIKRGQKQHLPQAFMVPKGKGIIAVLVWARGSYQGGKFEPSKHRMPITPLKTTSPFSMLSNKDVLKQIRGKTPADMQKEFIRQVHHLLNKRN